MAGQIGLEPTPESFVAKMVEVFREVRRVMRDDGTLWLNLGDSYVSVPGSGLQGNGEMKSRRIAQVRDNKAKAGMGNPKRPPSVQGLPPKNMVGIPWRVALALQADGWYLRSDIIWAKKNCMPESVNDRPTRAHEYIFLMTKSAKYFYDAEAIKERVADSQVGRVRDDVVGGKSHVERGQHSEGGRFTRGKNSEMPGQFSHHRIVENVAKARANGGSHDNPFGEMRNRRSWWPIATQPFPEAHFATFPPEIPETCIKAGTSERGCCLHCGAPAELVMERFDTGRRQKMADGWDTGEGGHGTIHRAGREKGEVYVSVMANKTTGWRLPCDCAEALKHQPNYSRCVVLDPFMGAGTTALAAAKLNRHFLGIELNQEYIKIAERRIAPELAQGKMF